MAEQVEEPVENNRTDKINNGSTESNSNGNNNNNNDEENRDKKKNVDPELFSCLLQPVTSDSDPDYIGIRRLLLYRKAESGARRRLDWRCNGKGYASYRNYIRRPRKLGQFAKPPKYSRKQWAIASIYKSAFPFVRGGQLDFQQGPAKYQSAFYSQNKFQLNCK
ncbi:hypothetical protein OIU74_003981 [Salix koriyanagi]|uniref:Uncharacterized protein n=1 Tax=Salix koriyanagi TaxID=2511006 RepID=A0A9Q0ZLR9_9ROSI|nr:hypothetical protein OIU74_003981 [Salix koriyanagi]